MKKIRNKLTLLFFCLVTVFSVTSCRVKQKNDHQHSFDMSAYVYDDNSHWYQCKSCEEVYNKSEHDMDSGVQTAATYDSEGYITYSCKTCDYEKVVVNQNKLVHSYDSAWSNDENMHWHACLDLGYTSLKQDEAAHNFGSGVQTPATYESAGFITFTCSVCNFQKVIENQEKLVHNYSNNWSYGDTHHWHACTDEGFETLKQDEAAHIDSNETIVTPATPTTDGVIEYTCSVCNHTYQKVIPASISVTTWPTVFQNVYVGQNLSDIILTGGAATLDGSFSWENPNQSITSNTTYKVVFVPTDEKYATITNTIELNVVQLTITSLSSGNGTVSQTGAINVDYGSNLTINITPNTGYTIDQIFVDNVLISNVTTYTFANITASHTIEVSFKELPVTLANYTVTFDSAGGSSVASVTVEEGSTVTKPSDPTRSGYIFNGWLLNNSLYDFASLVTSDITLVASWLEDSNNNNNTNTDTNLPFTLTFVEGTDGAYTWDSAVSTLIFNEVSADTLYIISGELNGNIVVNVGDTYKLELEMQGFTLTCSTINPITVLTGDEFTLTAKSEYENFIYDTREAIDETDTTLYSGVIHSEVDTTIGGKGSLVVESLHNNGIHSKKDLRVKNLTLSVTSIDNALKGNDSVTITNGNITLISKQGDGIKTTNSDISSQGNQRGTITITAATLNIYAACDGIDASYDVVIDDATTVLNVYTDKYSEYSETVTTTSESSYYIRYSNTYYIYGIKYYNSSDTSDYVWAYSSTTYEQKQGGMGKTYYYYTIAKKSGYDKMLVYMYSTSVTPNEDTNHSYVSSAVSVNDSYDTIKITYSNNTISVSWTNYSTSSGGGMGGMQEGNSDKGDYSTKGIKAANTITINEGSINVKSYDDAIHATKDTTVALENGAYGLGNVTINGGNVTVYSNDDGLHADGAMLIAGGDISVTNAYEGVEGNTITVTGGSVYVKSSDDGFNSQATSGAGITISGGSVYVYATGDGIDSNSSTSKGAIIFSGGDVVVICNSNGNSAIDSDGGYTQSAGRVIAIMSTGGMTSETTNGNTTGMTKKSSLSLSSGGYLTVTVSSTVVATVQMPCSLTAYVVYLGSSSATITSASTTSNTLNSHGVYWS